MSDDITRMPIEEFRSLGFLQEANRLFFHPLGLALEVIVDDDGSESLGGVWDYRSDPEGMLFGDLSDRAAADAAVLVTMEAARHREAREALLDGETVQPIGHHYDPEETA